MYIPLFTVEFSTNPMHPSTTGAGWIHSKDGLFLLAMKNLLKVKMELTVKELQVAFQKSKTGKAPGNRKPPK